MMNNNFKRWSLS